MYEFYIIYKPEAHMAPRYIHADYVEETPSTIVWANYGDEEPSIVYMVLKKYVATWSKLNRSIQ